jgi:GT2 family glycosyltransferase
MITLCVPTFNRMDLLIQMLESLKRSTMPIDKVSIIDNGGQVSETTDSLDRVVAACPTPNYEIFKPNQHLGLAACWNRFIKNHPEERLIVNDDILFAPGSVEAMVHTPGWVVSALLPTNAFSCFLIRDECVQEVGYFDEDISPGYAYFEDCDYLVRLKRKDHDITGVLCGVEHKGSQTVAAFTPAQQMYHHDRYMIARKNYLTKWGRLPEGVT